MNPKRKQRVFIISLMVLGVMLASGLALYALNQNINLYFTPSQIAANQAPPTHAFRVGGMVRKGSLHHGEKLQVSFVVTDMKKDLPVVYEGILPDLFREGQGVVLQGRLNAQGVFAATEVLAKHDEKYMPPPVADALKRGQA